jgi:hypothetical protein
MPAASCRRTRRRPRRSQGNGDAIVCAKQIDDKTFEYIGQPYPLYNFIDNTVATS